ncbi:hypothetical protein A6R68_01761, partial [Neotoma lepida]
MWWLKPAGWWQSALLRAGGAGLRAGPRTASGSPRDAGELQGELDRFGGVSWQSEGRVAAWLHVPILQSHFIASAASLGFRFHHAESHSSTLTLWLGEGPSRLPGYATHQVGVA